MADTTTTIKEETATEEPKAKAEAAAAKETGKKADASAEATTSLETTTTNDSSIPLNAEAPSTDSAAAATSAETPAATPAVPEEPVVISEQDVAKAAAAPEATMPKAEPEKSGTERLQDQIEILTGEVQALEAKIERLTSSATTVEPAAPASAPSPLTPSSEPTVPAPDMSMTPEAAPTETTDQAKGDEKSETKVEVKTDSTPAASASTAANDFFSDKGGAPVNDIFSRVSASGQAPKMPEPAAPAPADDTPGAVAVIGEVLVIIGIILFLLLMAAPLFREMMGEDLYVMIRSVGWLTSTATLALGALLALFGKARAIISVLGFIFLLGSAFFLIGISYPSLLGPLQGSLDSLMSFYR